MGKKHQRRDKQKRKEARIQRNASHQKQSLVEAKKIKKEESTMAAITAYCMKCRTKREVKDPKAITHKNGKAAVTGVCSVCGTKIYRMGKMPGAQTADTPAPAKAEQPKGKRSKVRLS